MPLQESTIWAMKVRQLDIPLDILDALVRLPHHPEISIHFVDLDGTILDDTKRFRMDPELRNRRWDSAYPYIVTKYSKREDENEAFEAFIRALDPSTMHLKGHRDFYDPENLHHVILTAWNPKFQQMKVDFSNLNPDPNRVILVEDATMKPLAMLKYFIKIGYIPGKVRFFDDRISNFDGIAEELSDLLHTDVSFYEALPDEAKQSVRVVKYVSEKIASSLPIEESPFRIQTTDQKPLPNEMH